MQKTLIITGQGHLSVVPDLVIITFPVESQNIDYSKAVGKLNLLVNKLRAAVKDSGLDPGDLKTTDFRVRTETRWNKQTDHHDFVGFKARHDLRIEFPLDKELMNTMIVNLVKLELNLDFKIEFGVSDKESCLESLIENAISNARKKAGIIASSSGITLKDIANINYSFKNIYFRSETNLEYLEQSRMLEADSMPDITPTDIELNETITITWNIES